MPPKKKNDAPAQAQAPKKQKPAKGKKKSPAGAAGAAESRALMIQRAKEERSLNLFYKLSEVEPEEETLEQRTRRQKKELQDNTFR